MRLVALVAAVGVTMAAGAARAEDVPADMQAAILLKVLAYDTSLEKRLHDQQVRILVVHKAGHAGSEATGREMTAAFEKLAGGKLKGKAIGVRLLAYATAADLAAELRGRGATLLYVCRGMASELADVQRLAREHQTLTAGGELGYVESRLALGVFVQGGRPTITVNERIASELGAVLGAGLLNLARVIR